MVEPHPEQIVVITGASRGIGLATAKVFLENGWTVIGTYSSTAIPINHHRFNAIKCDQASAQSIAHAVKQIMSQVSHIDVLVNNAGIILDGHDAVLDVGKLRKTLEVNLFGVVDFTEQLLPLVTSHIINVSSTYGSFSIPIDDTTSSAYRISKAALNMFTRTLAFRLEERGIVVSSLDPGWVRTDMGHSVATDTEGPNRDPHQPANEIFVLATVRVQTGQFWHCGDIRPW